MIAFLCDLDDTLFSTKKKIVHTDMLTLMSTLKDGAASGYATSRQMRLIDLMMKGDPDHLFIPVTARSEDAYLRVNLDAKLAVLAHGGIILRDGKRDEKWAAFMAARAASHTPISKMVSDITALDDKWRHWPLTDGDTELYYVIKNQDDDLSAVGYLFEFLKAKLPTGLSIQQNGNNIAILPDWLSKKSAVDYLLAQLRETTPDALAIGMGDSRSDLPFMLSCDYAVFPARSQVADDIKTNILK